jgi:transposase
MGCQWKRLPIRLGPDGQPEIHYSRLHRALSFLEDKGALDAVFSGTVKALHEADKLDVSVIHGDGTSTAAKKGGDNLGYNGHKHFKGDKVVAFCDRNGNVIAPFVSAPGNRNEAPLLRTELPKVVALARSIGLSLKGSIVSLDGVYDGQENRKCIFNHGMRPNIPENPRNRKTPKPGPKRAFDSEIFAERFFTIERVFAWEDKFKRLLLRFERKSKLHYALKSLAYAMINLRNFCQT